MDNSLSLSQNVRKRNGVPLGDRRSMRNMLYRSLGAKSFAVFWRYWNPIWGYYLSRNVMRPLKTLPVIALVVSLLLTGLVGKSFASDTLPVSTEERNLEKALYCMEILENRPDLESTERLGILKEACFSENYIQHAPHIADGREAVLKVFADRYKKYPRLSMSVKRSASEGDLVWLHLHVKHTPDALGAAIVHIFRMEDGKIAEHWGVGQPVPKESKNDNTMF